MRKLELSNRLALIANMFSNSRLLVDVGTDHAYLPIYLVQQGKVEYVIASDIKMGPLEIANKHINRYKLSEVISTRLSNGLQYISADEIDSIIIAGMGGLLISNILEASKDKVKCANQILIQPMYTPELVRSWLYRNGFQIIDESLCLDNNKIYNVIKAINVGKEIEYSEIDLYISRKLMEKKDRYLEEYLTRQIIVLTKIVKGLEKSTNSKIDYEKKQNILNQFIHLKLSI